VLSEPGRGYGDAVVLVLSTSRDLFAAIAASAAALTGLLFVALSVAPRRGPAAGPPIIQQIRVAAALLCFVNALAVSLYGLVPQTNVGYPSMVMGVIGILFTAAAIRSVLSSGSTRRQQLGQLGLVTLLLLIFGTEFVSGIAVIANASNSGQVEAIGYALVSSLIVGISRAWELVGDRETGMFASLAVLVGRTPPGAGGAPAPGTPVLGTPGANAGAGPEAGAAEQPEPRPAQAADRDDPGEAGEHGD
jgi:hypothetical protein